MNPPRVKSLLTPRELADAIGASESSLRRWLDGGDLRVARTAGGHRRIPLAEAIRFIRQTGAHVVRPELLGLVDFRQAAAHVADDSDDEALFQSLNAGEASAARSLLVSRYLAGESLPSLFDGPVCGALTRLGELWRHEERGILIEHRATQICIEAVGVLRGLLPPVENAAPLALGGAAEGDPYQLPTLMVGAVVADAGFRDVNFGPNTPVELLAREAIHRGARLVWVSISTPNDLGPLAASLKTLAAALASHKIDLLLGGRHHLECFPEGAENVKSVASMSELATLAAELRPAGASK